MKIRKGDTVKVLCGKNRGKTGKVLKVDPRKHRVIVEGVNLIKKHSRPTQRNQKGGIIEKEGSLHISNVQLMDVKNNMPTRVGFHFLRNEEGKLSGKMRISKKSGEVI
ncbi:MAG: 50S ribosomal protein L24 [candidate division Zixibacteria bacterium]|nr:50S ribosomal protein L24 [candidate division Zixibacteria bacterium]